MPESQSQKRSQSDIDSEHNQVYSTINCAAENPKNLLQQVLIPSLFVPQLNCSLFLNKDPFHKHEMQCTKQHYIKWKLEGFVTVH